MKRALLAAALVAALIFGAGAVHAASFTYHGTLQDSGKPAEGNYDIELTLYSAASGGSVIGGPLVMYKVPVHGANFSTQTDFGPLTKSFTQAYIAVRVRAAGNGPFAALDARSPMAVGATASVCPGAWTLGGNASNPAGSYLGTADSNPLTFEVNATQAGQITPSGNGTTSTPNVVFGYSGNSALSSGGATIAGGGDSVFGGNRVQGAFAAVGGGTKNTASGLWSTVAGGLANTAGGYASTVSGGQESNASGSSAMIPGGYSNAAGGDFSFAAGNNAVVRNASNTPDCSSGLNCGDYGTFVWADTSTCLPFTSTGPNQFLIQATGGVGINTSTIVRRRCETHYDGAGAVQHTTTRQTLHRIAYKGPNYSAIHYGPNGDWYIRSAAGMAAGVVITAGSGCKIPAESWVHRHRHGQRRSTDLDRCQRCKPDNGRRVDQHFRPHIQGSLCRCRRWQRTGQSAGAASANLVLQSRSCRRPPHGTDGGGFFQILWPRRGRPACG